MSELVFVSYSKSDPKGTALGTFTEAYEKSLGLEDNAIGNGSLAIHPDSSELALAAPGNYIKAYRNSVSAANLLGGFWIEYGGDRLLNDDEQGGQEWKRGGRGSIAVLEEALVWHRARSGTQKAVDRAKNRWVWKNAHPARVLVRLLEEAKSRGALPGVTWSFTRTRDSAGNKFSSGNFDKFVVPIGANLLDVVGMLRDNDLWVYMDGNLKLHAYDDEKDNDLSASIDIEEGVNIRDGGEREIAASTAKSHILMRGENEDEKDIYRAVANTTIKGQIGRRKEGYFEYPRTATKRILERVGNRKLRKWKKRSDGPFTLGIIDTTGQVAGVDFTVGDEVNVNIPGAYNNSAERVVGILFQDRQTGEYDVTVDLGEFGHDPVSGAYLGGDSEGTTPCGCKGKKPGTGFGGGGGKDTPGVPGTTPVKVGTFVLDDFNRASSEVGYGHESGISLPLDPISDISGFDGHRRLHEIPLPDGARAVGDVVALFGSMTAQHDGGTPNIAYAPVVGRAPRIINVAYQTYTDFYADEMTIPLPDGIRPGTTLFVHCVFFTNSGTFGNFYDWSGAGWTGDWGFSQGGLPSMSECVPVRQIDGTEGYDGVNDTVVLGDVSAVTHTLVDRAVTFAFLVEGAVDLGDALGADDEVGWNGSWGSSVTGTESFDPTSGWWNWATNDLTLYMAVGYSDESFSGDFTNLDTVKDDGFTGPAGGGGVIYQVKWALAYERSDTFSTGGGITYSGTANNNTRIFALRGGPSWTGFEGHTNISHAPTMHRFAILDAGDLEPGGMDGTEDVVSVWFDDQAGLFNDLEPAIGYDTLSLDNPTDYDEGSDLLHGPTDQMYYNDMVGPSPNNGDFLYFGYAAKGGVGAEWIDSDVGSVSGGVLSNAPLTGFVPLSIQPTYDYATGIPAHALVAFRSDSNLFEYTFSDRYGPKHSQNASDEDGSTISTGANGGGLSMTGYVLMGGDGTGIGNILTSGENGGSPWAGGNPWFYVTGNTGGLTGFGVDGSSLYAEGNAGASGNGWATFSVTEDSRVLPFTGEDWEIEVRYRVSGVVPDNSGQHHMLFSWQYPYMSLLVQFDSTTTERLRLGSGVSGAVTSEFIKTLAGGNSTGSEAWGRFKWRKEGSNQYAKEWADSGSEPGGWELSNIILESALDEALETYGSIGEFEISLITGNNGGTAMKVEVDWVKVTTFPAEGESVANSFVAYGDNTTVKFFVNPFRAGTLRVWVDGFPVDPIEENSEQGWFRLDRAPYGDPSDETGSARITASYERAAGE